MHEIISLSAYRKLKKAKMEAEGILSAENKDSKNQNRKMRGKTKEEFAAYFAKNSEPQK